MARRLRRERFDVAIDLHGGPRERVAGVGERRADAHRLHDRRTLVDVHPRRRRAPPDLDAAALGAEPVGPAGAARHRRLRSDPRSGGDGGGRGRSSARASGASRGRHRPSDPLVVIHVSAGNPFRRWPAESFARCVRGAGAPATRGRRVILISGPSDQAAAAAIAQRRARDGSARWRRACSTGEYDLRELRALIARAAVYIGGDSGPLHVAATTRTPIVALLGADAAGTVDAVARSALVHRGGRAGALPCRPCDQRHVRAGRFPVPDAASAPEQVVAAAERALQHWEEHRSLSVDGPVMTGIASMTTTTMTALARPTFGLDRAALWLLLGVRGVAAGVDRRRQNPAERRRSLAWAATAGARPRAARGAGVLLPLVAYAGATLVVLGLLARSD